MNWWPRRLDDHLTSARDWYVLLVELGPRVVESIRTENHFARFPR